MNDAKGKTEKARHDLERAIEDQRALQGAVGPPALMQAYLKRALRRRAWTFTRVNGKLIRESKLAEARKAQLHEAWRRYDSRRRERERRRERDRNRDLGMDLSDD